MSMATLEREILAEAKELLNNPKLRLKDLLEWSTGKVRTKTTAEVVVALERNTGISICVNRAHDKRDRLERILAALHKHHTRLDNREHGEVSACVFIEDVREILGVFRN